jgi:2-polyprenyl-3-methyl-5-hydroxy-6-metoxy-1,4-benzoquinol methylase
LPDNKLNGYYRHERREMLGFIPHTARSILEVGCGAGDFGSILKSERKAEVWGIELIPEVAKKASLKLDRIMVGNIETGDMPLPDGYFDCIVFNDVLEHLTDPWRVLSRLKANLTQNGLVVASIPNVRFYLVMKELFCSKRWEYKDAGVLDRTHLRFFTESGIRQMFESTGYRIVTLEGIRAYDFSWKFRLLNRLFFKGLEDMRYEQYACVAQTGHGISAL